MLLAVLVFTSIRMNNYQVKELVDVLDVEEIEEVSYRKQSLDDAEQLNHIVNNPESIQELIGFFHQYKVKKIGTKKITSKYTDEQFVFQLEYVDERITLPSLIENDVVLIGEDQYMIVNGPVDYQWIEDFIEKSD